jgi:hypothetical protein
LAPLEVAEADAIGEFVDALRDQPLFRMRLRTDCGTGRPSEQCQEVLVLVIRHLCTLGGELQREAGRLSVALQRRMTD